MQALPPPRRRALTPSPVVQPGHGSAADGSVTAAPPQAVATVTGDGAPADAAPTAAPVVPRAVPAPRHELPGGGTPGFLSRARQRPTLPDSVVFTAPCPACGADAQWSEEREDTRLRALVDCPCG